MNKNELYYYETVSSKEALEQDNFTYTEAENKFVDLKKSFDELKDYSARMVKLDKKYKLKYLKISLVYTDVSRYFYDIDLVYESYT